MITATKYKTYSKYKPSGIDWLGDIPAGWEECKLKYLSWAIEDGGTPSRSEADNFDGDINWLVVDDIKDEINETKEKISEKGYKESNAKIWDVGDIIISFGATIGEVGIANIPLTTKQGIAGIKVNEKIFTKYLFYTLKILKDYLNAISVGTTIFEIRPPKLKQIIFPFPEKTVQKSIADFLDRETAKIDEMVAKKQKMIDLLKEKRQALITHAVTKGIDTKAKMKPSGIDWLGDIPEGWKVKRLNYLLKNVVDKATDDDKSDLIIALENIESWSGKFVSPENQKSPEGDLKKFIAGDVLFGKLRPYLAKAMITERDGLCVGEALVFRTNKFLINKFLLHRILTADFINYIDSSTQGAKMPRAEWEFIKTLQVAYPSREEQQKIIDYIDRETAKINEMMKKVEMQIEKLQEYRQALITNAVTGKIKI